ncbi:hypothetical protein JCM9533A_60430 [Catenuloplanes niger JCM 9533]
MQVVDPGAEALDLARALRDPAPQGGEVVVIRGRFGTGRLDGSPSRSVTMVATSMVARVRVNTRLPNGTTFHSPVSRRARSRR